MIPLLSLLLRLARCSSGTASLESIIILPVAISLMAGGVEFGRIYTTASTADKSMRSAARYLARVPSTGTAICDWGLTNAKNLAVYGNLAGTGSPLIPGWSTANVTLQQPSSCPATSPIIIQLQASVPFTAVMLSAIGLANSFTFHVQHEERSIGE